MSNSRRGARPPRDLLGPLAGRLFALLVPADFREAFIGDLLEEAHRFIAPARGPWRARLWLWRQLLGSLPTLLGRRAGTMGRMGRRQRLVRRLVVGLAGLVALGQARDAAVFGAPPVVVGLVLAGIGLPVATGLLVARRGRYLAAVVTALPLLATARFASPTPLPDLFIALTPLGFIVLLDYGLARGSHPWPGGAGAGHPAGRRARDAPPGEPPAGAAGVSRPPTDRGRGGGRGLPPRPGLRNDGAQAAGRSPRRPAGRRRWLRRGRAGALRHRAAGRADRAVERRADQGLVHTLGLPKRRGYGRAGFDRCGHCY